jgi:protein-tyrosine phosphatase
MIDIHTHILYDIDDGSTSLENSMKHIANMSNAGVTDIFLTPHFIRFDFPTDKISIDERFQNLNKEISKQKINVTLHKACEIYLDDNIWQDIEAQDL